MNIVVRHIICIGLLALTVQTLAPAQEADILNGNTLSATVLYELFGDGNRLEAGCAYTLGGAVQMAYTRSSILTRPRIDNSRHELFVRYLPARKKRLFTVLGVGLIYGKAHTDAEIENPRTVTRRGMAVEAGIILVAETRDIRHIIVSVSYRYDIIDAAVERPGFRDNLSEIGRSFTVGLAGVFYWGPVGWIVGPRLGLYSDFSFDDAFFGVQTSLVFIH